MSREESVTKKQAVRSHKTIPNNNIFNIEYCVQGGCTAVDDTPKIEESLEKPDNISYNATPNPRLPKNITMSVGFKLPKDSEGNAVPCDFCLSLKIGIIRDLYSNGLITQKQMEIAIEKLTKGGRA